MKGGISMYTKLSPQERLKDLRKEKNLYLEQLVQHCQNNNE